MYKVMIIDDEHFVRRLLRMVVPWQDYDMEVVGEAASGIEAINTIDELQPDLCFVDIKMPFMNGIQFSKLAIDRYPQLQIIILTAFADFEYARECIGTGVVDYRLKPITKKDIQEAACKVKKNLDEQRMRKGNGKGKEKDYSQKMQENTIEKIKEYLKVNYTEQDLNLTKAALEFGFNSSYLSRKFKQETGVSFIDYLTSLRMEQAKHLAHRGEAMYQAASEVGIPDSNYFSKCFKKYMNLTYTEYSLNNKKI